MFWCTGSECTDGRRPTGWSLEIFNDPLNEASVAAPPSAASPAGAVPATASASGLGSASASSDCERQPHRQGHHAERNH